MNPAARAIRRGADRMPTPLDHRALYRLPWNLADNPIAWLEPTQQCNLACDGCYRENVKEHDSIEEVQADLDVFARLRNFDGVSIAGGDPLMHPHLLEIVRRVTRMGRKAIINTNGLALTREMLVDLKRAGLCGLTFHVDSRQGRPGWRNKTEVQMNDLRSEFVELVSSVGDLALAFNSTVYEETLHEVPDLVDWAARYIGRVHTMVFITYRAAMVKGFDYYSGGEKIDISPLVYASDRERRIDISSREVADVIRARFPDFMPCAYLNGTEKPDSFKWLLATRIGRPGRVHGYVGPKFMELVQTGYHMISGRYMSYAPSWTMAAGRSSLAAAVFDRGVRNAAWNYLGAIARDPREALGALHVQNVLMIQPIDVLENGRQNMCDGCPDMTVHDGKLVWSCRLEEPRKFGHFLTTVPQNDATRLDPRSPVVRVRTSRDAS
jgi:MoaA/NifB/PqqE/SkfB family radical SAM enzyme